MRHDRRERLKSKRVTGETEGARTAIGFAPILLLAVVASCTPEPAELMVRLVGPAVGEPQFFHGNCFAGSIVRVDLQVQETQGVALRLERLSYRLSDEGRGVELAAEVLVGEALDERYGGRRLDAGGIRVLSLGAPSGSRPVGPIAVTGGIAATDRRVPESGGGAVPP